MVGGGVGMPCDRLPFELTVCSCCGQGVKQARGWTWIDVAKFFQGPHVVHEREPGFAPELCLCERGRCPLCQSPATLGRAGLLWIGEKFYKTPFQFIKEGIDLGFSRRIKAVPQGFKVGETYIMLAHSKAFISHNAATETTYNPGIFYCWLPQRLEKIFKESEQGSEEVQASLKRGINPVFVPDNDPDHKGKKSEAGE
jgi:hypothetical protein